MAFAAVFAKFIHFDEDLIPMSIKYLSKHFT